MIAVCDVILTFTLYYLFLFIPGTIPEGVGKLGALKILRLVSTFVSGKTLLVHELIECIAQATPPG